jgi:hypothetical protein
LIPFGDSRPQHLGERIFFVKILHHTLDWR